MVGGDGVDDRLALPVFPGHFHADLHMRALHLVIQGLADVVQQAGPFGHGGVQPQFRGHHPRQISHL